MVDFLPPVIKSEAITENLLIEKAPISEAGGLTNGEGVVLLFGVCIFPVGATIFLVSQSGNQQIRRNRCSNWST